MKLKKNLIFVGMMGSGKTSIGSLVAKKLKLNFIDIDNEIENTFNTTVKKIFEVKGEDFFRKIEQEMTLKKLQSNSSVISIGGGGFANKIIRKEILKNHLSFWLNWDEKIIFNRIKNSKKRPLAFNSSEDELVNLIKRRALIYSKAMYKIKCDSLTKNEIVNKILQIYEKN